MYRVEAVVVITSNLSLAGVQLSLRLVIGVNVQVLQVINIIIIVKLMYPSGIIQENG